MCNPALDLELLIGAGFPSNNPNALATSARDLNLLFFISKSGGGIKYTSVCPAVEPFVLTAVTVVHPATFIAPLLSSSMYFANASNFAFADLGICCVCVCVCLCVMLE